GAETVEQRLPEGITVLLAHQALDDERKMQQKEVETAADGIGNAVFAVEDRASRLRHDHAIQARNGVGLLVSAKQGEDHRFFGFDGLRCRAVTAWDRPMQAVK